MTKLVDVFLFEDQKKYEKIFYDSLRKMASGNNGKIPLTHVTNPPAWKKIQATKRIIGSLGQAEINRGVFATVGHLDVRPGQWPLWAKEMDFNDSEKGYEAYDEYVVLQLDVPLSEITKIVPDSDFFVKEQIANSQDDPAKFFELTFKRCPDLKNCEVVLLRDVPISWIKNVLVGK